MPHYHNTRSSKLSAVANGTAAPLGDTSTPSTQPCTVPNPYNTVIRVPVATVVATTTLNDCVLAALDDHSRRNSATPSEVAGGATDPCTDVCTPPRNARNDVEHSNPLPIPVVTPAVASPPSALASTPVPSVISTNKRSREEREEQEGELVVQEQEYSTVYLPPATDSPTNGPVVPEMTVGLPVGSGEEAKPSTSTPPSNDFVDGVSSLSAAAAHVNAAEVTDGSRFAKGTTNNTRKYSLRKKKLITEFVDVLKKMKKSMQGF